MLEGSVMVMVTVEPAGILVILKEKKPWGKLKSERVPHGVEVAAGRLVIEQLLAVKVTVPVPVAVTTWADCCNSSSKAPISQYVPCGLTTPRWSVVGAPSLVPVLKAGLLAVMACVEVMPPLFCRASRGGLGLRGAG